VRGVDCTISTAPDHPSLSVRKQLGITKTRKLVRVTGISPPVQLFGFNNSINTLERAVKERVFFVKNKEGKFVSPPRPAPMHFEETLRGSLDMLVKFLPKTVPLSRLQFVETFRGRKKKIYQAAYESLLGNSFSVKDAFVKVFVKYEKTDHTTKTDPVPRVISPRSPRYNVELGRFLRPLEERIFKSLSCLYGHRTVIKGMNSSNSAKCLFEKWSQFKRPVAIGLDASRFDQHVSVDALKFEHSVYGKCFPFGKHRKQLAKLLKLQLRNNCVGYTADGRVKYQVEGARMSGDMNTSLGNCILMCVMIHSYASACGIKLQLANNGDDCVVFMEQNDLAKFQVGLDEWFLGMGFNMTVEEPCYIFEQIEFCQTHPVWVGPAYNDYIMVRNPHTAIAKDTVCIKQCNTPAMFRGWLHAVGTGGMAMAGQVPVFQDFYQAYLKSGKEYHNLEEVNSWGVKTLITGMNRNYGLISPMVRASFYWAFGVMPSEQLVAEAYYRSVQISSEFTDQPVVFQRDLPV